MAIPRTPPAKTPDELYEEKMQGAKDDALRTARVVYKYAKRVEVAGGDPGGADEFLPKNRYEYDLSHLAEKTKKLYELVDDAKTEIDLPPAPPPLHGVPPPPTTHKRDLKNLLKLLDAKMEKHYTDILEGKPPALAHWKADIKVVKDELEGSMADLKLPAPPNLLTNDQQTRKNAIEKVQLELKVIEEKALIDTLDSMKRTSADLNLAIQSHYVRQWLMQQNYRGQHDWKRFYWRKVGPPLAGDPSEFRITGLSGFLKKLEPGEYKSRPDAPSIFIDDNHNIVFPRHQSDDEFKAYTREVMDLIDSAGDDTVELNVSKDGPIDLKRLTVMVGAAQERGLYVDLGDHLEAALKKSEEESIGAGRMGRFVSGVYNKEQIDAFRALVAEANEHAKKEDDAAKKRAGDKVEAKSSREMKLEDEVKKLADIAAEYKPGLLPATIADICTQQATALLAADMEAGRILGEINAARVLPPPAGLGALQQIEWQRNHLIRLEKDARKLDALIARISADLAQQNQVATDTPPGGMGVLPPGAAAVVIPHNPVLATFRNDLDAVYLVAPQEKKLDFHLENLNKINAEYKAGLTAGEASVICGRQAAALVAARAETAAQLNAINLIIIGPVPVAPIGLSPAEEKEWQKNYALGLASQADKLRELEAKITEGYAKHNDVVNNAPVPRGVGVVPAPAVALLVAPAALPLNQLDPADQAKQDIRNQRRGFR